MYKIIYEDDFLIVVDKPSGMLVVATPKKEKNTLTDLLNRELDRRGVEVNAYPCHRLDRETSGVIVYAKGNSMQKLMMDKFRKREVKKKYIAVVQGRLPKSEGTINSPIFNRNKKRNEPATTKYKVLEIKNSFTVLEVEPVTGRTNQIRVHLAKIGHPIVGESLYAFRKDFKLRFRRTALHAARIAFKHPVSGKDVEFEAQVPADMNDLMNSGG